MVKNPPANAGDTGSIPNQEGSHLPRSNEACMHNYCICALEPGSRHYGSPHALEPVLHNKRIHINEKPTHRN